MQPQQRSDEDEQSSGSSDSGGSGGLGAKKPVLPLAHSENGGSSEVGSVGRSHDIEEEKVHEHHQAQLRQLETLKGVLEHYSAQEAAELFTLYSDTRQQSAGKLVLTEAQFNLVKKVYPKCFSSSTGRFSLTDNQIILQFFFNMKHLYGQLQRGSQSQLGHQGGAPR